MRDKYIKNEKAENDNAIKNPANQSLQGKSKNSVIDLFIYKPLHNLLRTALEK